MPVRLAAVPCGEQDPGADGEPVERAHESRPRERHGQGVALWLGQFVHEIDQRQRDFEQASERHVGVAANSRCPQHLHLPRALFCVREQRALPGACFAAEITSRPRSRPRAPSTTASI